MVKVTPPMVDMAMTTAEIKEYREPSPPKYPYGLCISLCQDELDKLGLEQDDLVIGATIHLFCMAKITSVSSREDESNGPQCRVELQITNIAAEDEDDENETVADKVKKLYK